ncbi:hypothetical protein ACQ4M4_02780 [Leptolyngbya sp. AN02str]|uniref:hypothetical protein n=1 Tax=Leptolyngbya sp. AN02str TaxID=3423363 RepID=UPI003D313DCB
MEVGCTGRLYRSAPPPFYNQPPHMWNTTQIADADDSRITVLQKLPSLADPAT